MHCLQNRALCYVQYCKPQIYKLSVLVPLLCQDNTENIHAIAKRQPVEIVGAS